MTDYLADNILIADLNNEKATKNPTYKANIASLNHMALATASKDIVVVPHQSGHFEFFPSGSEAPKDILPLRQSHLGIPRTGSVSARSTRRGG